MGRQDERVAISRAEAAKLVGVCERTLYRLELEGRGPRVARIGRRVLYSMPELQRWIARHGAR